MSCGRLWRAPDTWRARFDAVHKGGNAIFVQPLSIMEKEGGGGGPLLWEDLVARAEDIANKPFADLGARSQQYQPDITKAVDLWKTARRGARRMTHALVGFLSFAMIIFFGAFLALVHPPTSPDYASLRCYMLLASGVLVVGTGVMIGLMAKS